MEMCLGLAKTHTHTHTNAGTSTLRHMQRDTNNNNYCRRSFVEICSFMQKTDPQINLLLTSKSMCFSMWIQMRVKSSPSTNTAATPAPASLIFTLRVVFFLFVCFVSFLHLTSQLKIRRVRCHLLFIYSKIPRYTNFCESLFFTPAEQARTVNY